MSQHSEDTNATTEVNLADMPNSAGCDTCSLPSALESQKPQAAPPDGGALAWSQIFAGHLINTVTWGYITGFGVFQTYYQENLPNSASEISWIGGVQVFLCFSIGTIAGRATDAGFAREVVLIGSCFLVFGTFMTSFATAYWQIFLAQGLCVGIGLGTLWLPSVTLISTYFVRNRTVALACATSGASTGSMIWPAMIQYLTPQIGFPWAVRSMGFLVLLFTIVFNGLLRTRLPPRKSGPLVEWSAFTEPPYVLFTIGVFLLYWPVFFAFFYIQTFARDTLGFSSTESVNLIIITNAAGVLVRPPLGYIADRHLGPLNCLIPAVTVCAAVLYCWIAVKDAAGLYVFAVFYGIASAASMGLFAGTVPSLTKDLGKIGTRVGMVLTLMSLGPLTGQSLAGVLLQQDHDDYLSAQLWGASSMLLGAISLLASRLWASGWHLKVKL